MLVIWCCNAVYSQTEDVEPAAGTSRPIDDGESQIYL